MLVPVLISFRLAVWARQIIWHPGNDRSFGLVECGYG